MVALTPVTGGPFYGEVLAGISRVLAPAGGRLVVVQTIDAGLLRDEVVTASDDAPPVALALADAVIAITTGGPKAHLDRVRAAGKPVVLASGAVEGFPAASATPDNVRGVVAAVRHLLGHGHRRIGFVGNGVHSDVRERHRAYEQTLLDHGIDTGSAWCFEAPDHGETGGRAAARALLAGDLPVTALLAATDRNALGLIEELGAAGLGVPADVAVVGVDGIERGSFSSPTLATVRQDFVAVGTLAAELLLAELAGEPVRREPHVVPSVFLPRESCGCAGTADEQAGDPAGGAPLPGALSAIEATAGQLAPIAAAVTSGLPAPAVDLGALVAEVRALGLSADELRVVVDALTEQLSAMGQDAPGDREALTRLAGQLAGRLWQGQAATYLDRASTLERAVQEHYDVGHRLLDGTRGDARRLTWMADTDVRSACFATWTGDPADLRLEIVGTYAPDDELDGLTGREVLVVQFPPPEMVASAARGRSGVTFVIPVRWQDTDYGVLAIEGDVDTTAASGREKYNQWAALLASSLEPSELHEAVHQSEERYTLAARATNDGLWDWNLAEDTIYFSDRCLTLLGVGRAEGPGRPGMWFDRVHPDDVGALRGALDDAVASGAEAPIEVEHRVGTPEGGHRYLLCRALPVASLSGRVERVVGSLSDIHHRKELEERLRRSALHDAVTGLPNRTLFQDRLAQAMAHARRTEAARYAVLFIDLDHFKEVNDTLGHAVGDELLTEVGHRLRASIREVDVAARFGGDEFALLLHDVEPDGVRAAVERILASLREPLELAGRPITVSASVGIALGAARYTDPDEVLRDADTAMYQVKASRRGSYRTFEPS